MTRRSKAQILAWTSDGVIFPKRNAFKNCNPTAFQKNQVKHHEFKLNLHEFFSANFLFGSKFQPKIQPKKTFTQKVCWLFFLLESGQKPSQKPPLNPGGPSTTMCFMGTRRRVALEAKSFNSSPPWGFFVFGATGHLGNICYVIW